MAGYEISGAQPRLTATVGKHGSTLPGDTRHGASRDSRSDQSAFVLFTPRGMMTITGTMKATCPVYA